MLENILANKISENQELKGMTKEELHKRIDQAENDFKNGQFKSSDELLEKYQ
ncbi:hypothetical protein [Kordia algicida]|nr:hypothetical protein [Kordia algicida]